MDRAQTDSDDTPSPRRILMLGYDGANAIDIVGPLDILSATNLSEQDKTPAYVIDVVSPAGGLISTFPSGVQIQTRSYKSIRPKHIDTLLVAGGEAFEEYLEDKALLRWITTTAKKSRRVASVCTGAFLLAAAGLLDGRRATTHWRWADRLSSAYPKITVEPDRIYTKDERIYTSAGITAGMDLALALAEEDFGARVAREIARNWVIFTRRPGGQSQFSELLPEVENSPNQTTANEAIESVVAWIHDHPSADLGVDALATKANMSPRNFARRFNEHVGLTPAKYVERVRLAAARNHLENSNASIETIANRTGFLNTERMRRSFERHLRVSPQNYRNRFQFSDKVSKEV